MIILTQTLNPANLKDYVNIAFWIVTGILAISTYLNARKTLFNPIRSEMVKYQMKIITDFIDKHTSKNYDFDTTIDYSNVLKLTIDADYLFDIFDNERAFDNHTFDETDENLLKYCKANLAGIFEIQQDGGNLKMEQIYGDFDMTKLYLRTKYVKEKEKKYDSLNPQRIYITKKFLDFYTDLVHLQTNPFVPENIKEVITSISTNISNNIMWLHKHVSDYLSEQSEPLNYQDILSAFNNSKVDHTNDFMNLRIIISQYFKVNSFN